MRRRKRKLTMLKRRRKNTKNYSLKTFLAKITHYVDNNKWFKKYGAFEHIISVCDRLDKSKGNNARG